MNKQSSDHKSPLSHTSDERRDRELMPFGPFDGHPWSSLPKRYLELLSRRYPYEYWGAMADHELAYREERGEK